jgi:putative ABC transport system permease protein
MTKIALKDLLGRKLRLILTSLAIVMGVAMVSGTFVLTDTIKKGFDTIFSASLANADAVVTGKAAFGSSSTGIVSFPASTLGKIRALPDVAEAEGGIGDLVRFVGRDGKVITRGGAPGLAFSVNPTTTQRFNPLTIVQGRWPRGPHEVVMDEKTASTKHYAVGDSVGVAARGPVQMFRISGVARFGKLASIGGATLAIFDLPTAQKLFGKEGRLDEVDVAAKPGVSRAKLLDQVRSVLPPQTQARSGAAQAQENSKDTSSFIGFLQKFLLAFGGVALFVGSFVIANTLSITIAQRTREFATLRTMGATRRQILSVVVVEGLVIGFLASVVGLFVGLGLAQGLNALFVAFGIDLPKSGTVFATRTIVVSLVLGTLITLLASLRPAMRATRVPPIAAVREGSVIPPGRFARFGPAAAIALCAVSLGLVSYGAFGHGLTGTQRLLLLGIGVLGLFVGVAMVAPILVKPLARVLGWPATKIGGVAGELARSNSIRNPARTASTAAALMIGLALVTLVAVLAQGLKGSFEDAVNKLFHADYALTSQDGFTPMPIAAADALRHAPGIDVVAGVRGANGRAFGKEIQVTAVEPGISKVIRMDWKQGSDATMEQLGRDGAVVAKDYAKSHHLTVGSPLRVETPAGKFLSLKLDGIFDPPGGGSPFGAITTSSSTFDSVYPQPSNIYTFLNVPGGVTAANTQRLDAQLKSFPDAKIQTEQEFKDSQEQGINILLNLLFVLLGLSIIVSLFGIVNTLVLTVFERTRELGMLRAVGMTRRQTRRMIRHESVVTALIGAALGIPVGIVLAALVGQAIDFAAFAVPWTTLIVFVIAAIVVGLLAAIFPARRASRLNVLEALHYE